MAKLMLAQLERHPFAAAGILRGTMDAAECRDFIFVLRLQLSNRHELTRWATARRLV